MTENKRTRLSLLILMVAAAVMGLIAVIKQDWTLLIWVTIAGGQAGLLRYYVGLVDEQAEIIRQQRDLIDRWTALSPKILRGLGGESDD